MTTPECRFVFKIVYPVPNLSETTIELSELDKESGFIHLSSGEQVPRTCHLFFSDFETLYIIKFRYEKIEADIKWERAPDGELFPHLYGDLRTSDVDSVRTFRRGKVPWIDVLGRENWLKN
jgi:uncharacterized protein (DUF952 family)